MARQNVLHAIKQPIHSWLKQYKEKEGFLDVFITLPLMLVIVQEFGLEIINSFKESNHKITTEIFIFF